MKTLVTGSCGLVGTEAVKFFKEKGEAIGIDNNMRNYFFGTPKAETENDIDIRDFDALIKLFREHKFDLIVHTAAQPSHDWAAKFPMVDFEVNAQGTLNLLECFRLFNPEAVFVTISTNKVYGDNPNKYISPATERPYHSFYSPITFDESLSIDDCVHSLFGCSKLAGDIYTQEYGKYWGLKTGVFRLGCITGSAHKGAEQHGFLSYLVKCVKEGKPYTVYGYDGEQVRDNIHAYDLVTAIYEFYKDPKPGEVYNLGGGPDRAISVKEALMKAMNMVGNLIEITYSDKVRKGDHYKYVTDCSKFMDDYPDWEYKYSLDDIFKDLIG